MLSFPVLFFNLLSIGMLLGVLIAVWRVRSKRAASELFITVLFMLIWSLTSFAEMVSYTFFFKVLWRNICQIGVFYTPVATLLFSLAYTGYWREKQKQIGRILYIYQGVGIILVGTDFLHHWIRHSVSLVTSSQFSTLVVETTVLAKFLISGNFFLMVFSLVLVIVFVVTTSTSMRKQAYILLLGMVIPFLYAMAKVVSNEQFLQILPISGVFALSGLFLLLGIYRFDLLKLAPLAREQAFRFLGEGIVICDGQGHVVDMNPAAKGLLGTDMGLIEEQMYLQIPRWGRAVRQSERTSLEFALKGRSLFAELYPITSKATETIGTITLIQDVTLLKQRAEELQHRAEIDGLTGLYNRQTFIEKVERQLSLATGESHLIYFDLDHFKQINDQWGHRSGDAVLQSVGSILKEEVDEACIVCRFGGEEFAIFSSHKSRDEMIACAEHLRKYVELHIFTHEQYSIRLTVSLGVSSAITSSFDELYREADACLYEAKKAGRNCVRIRSTPLD
nr:diguanylate cyclase [uncultured Sphaerochaeta sp.]